MEILQRFQWEVILHAPEHIGVGTDHCRCELGSSVDFEDIRQTIQSDNEIDTTEIKTKSADSSASNRANAGRNLVLREQSESITVTSGFNIMVGVVARGYLQLHTHGLVVADVDTILTKGRNE